MAIQTTLNFINERTNDFKPEIGIILGSGLGDFANEFSSIRIPYFEIPGFESSTIQGHAGQLLFTRIKDKNVMIMQGRFHFYEGHSMDKIIYPIKIMKKLGTKTLIVTNAAGAVNETFKPSDLMIITDHINLMGKNPLFGPNDDDFGTRFPDMSEIYKKHLVELALDCAKNLGIEIQKGVYAACTGPSYETPAEIGMLKTIGADAVGMSTTPETIFANYCGMDVLGVSCISNYAAGIQKTPLSHQEVIESTNLAKDKFQNLILKILEKL